MGRIEILPYALEDNTMYCGHLISVAVNDRFRGNGVAKQLLDILHSKLASEYEANSISLFCRVRLNLISLALIFLSCIN